MTHPKKERTFVMIKPDGVNKGLIGEIIGRFEQRGLKVVALEMMEPDRVKIDAHYPTDKEWIARLGGKTLSTMEKYNIDPVQQHGTSDPFIIGESVREWLLEYMTSGPLVKMIVEGIHAVDMVRKIVGPTLPYLAELGTIRGDFSIDSPILATTEKRAVMNLVHASETPEEAQHEINHWFNL
jgi:nucleoside-diphosphate kinase